MSTGKKDRYLDLLFFNRHLRRLIALDLKFGDFDPAYKGQMEWYLNWLDKNEHIDYEERPIGIILCAGKIMTTLNIWRWIKPAFMWRNLTELPPKEEILKSHLRKAIAVAKKTY